MVEVCTHDVHFVNVNHSRNAVVIGLTPYSLGLRLNAALCAENRNRTVKNSQGTLNLNGEVNVSGGVDDVDSVLLVLVLTAFPESGGRSRGDGDTALFFLRHPVHCGSAVVGLANLMVYAGVVQDTLSCGSFTGVDVSHDADVSCLFK